MIVDVIQERCLFPEEWWGLEKENLERETGIHGAKFVHSTGFKAKATSPEAALKMIDFALDRIETVIQNSEEKRYETHPSGSVIDLKRWVSWKSYSDTVLKEINF